MMRGSGPLFDVPGLLTDSAEKLKNISINGNDAYVQEGLV